jgi:hypothetical protein
MLFAFVLVGISLWLPVSPAVAVEPGEVSWTAQSVCLFRAIAAQHPDPKLRNPDDLAESRGRRKQGNQDEWIPRILEPDGSSREWRRNWARLIQKIYQVDSLTCPKCSGKMKVISVIEDEEVTA